MTRYYHELAPDMVSMAREGYILYAVFIVIIWSGVAAGFIMGNPLPGSVVLISSLMFTGVAVPLVIYMRLSYEKSLKQTKIDRWSNE